MGKTLPPLPSDKKPPTLGKDVPWKQVEGQLLRVKSHLFVASMQDSKVKAPPVGAYAALEVECAEPTGDALIMVSHKLDFKHLWELYKERKVLDDEEVLVAYAPVGRGIGRAARMFLPCLDIMVYPKGWLEEACDPTFKPKNTAEWFQERARWRPNDYYTARESGNH